MSNPTLSEADIANSVTLIESDSKDEALETAEGNGFSLGEKLKVSGASEGVEYHELTYFSRLCQADIIGAVLKTEEVDGKKMYGVLQLRF